jgi:hypothetical protein
MMRSSLKTWLSSLNAFRSRGSGPRRKTPYRRAFLNLEHLETRLTPSSGTIGNAVPVASWNDPNNLVSSEALASSNAHALFVDAELNPSIAQTPSNPTGSFYITLPTDIPGHVVFQGEAANEGDPAQTSGAATPTDDGLNTILFTPGHGDQPPVYNFVVKSDTGSADIYTVHIREAGAPTQPTDISTVAQPPAVTLPGNGSTVTLTDTATLSSPNENLPVSGTITFTLTDNGVAVAAATQTVSVSSFGDHNASYTLPSDGSTVAGTYVWSATFTSTSSNYDNATDDGINETSVVSPASPSIVTQASGPVTLDASGAPTISDQITMSGAYFPTGNVNVTLTLTTTQGSTTVKTDSFAAANGTVTENYTLPTSGTVAGTYTWSVSYAGDGNNNSAVDQGGTAEQTVVTPATPSITTSQQPASAMVGIPIGDQATVSGGYNPTGTVTFALYNNPNGTGTALFVDANEPLVNGVATSKLYTTSATGTDYWVATYNGDGNNVSVTSGTALEPVTVFGGGLTPGFWENNADNWGGSAWKFTQYSPTTNLSSVFNLGSFSGLDTTLQNALNTYQSAGSTATDAAEKLLWDSTAAVLNASYNYNGTTIGYPLTTSQITSQVNTALASGDRTTILQEASLLDLYNNLGFTPGIAQKTGKPGA